GVPHAITRHIAQIEGERRARSDILPTGQLGERSLAAAAYSPSASVDGTLRSVGITTAVGNDRRIAHRCAGRRRTNLETHGKPVGDEGLLIGIFDRIIRGSDVLQHDIPEMFYTI